MPHSDSDGSYSRGDWTRDDVKSRRSATGSESVHSGSTRKNRDRPPRSDRGSAASRRNDDRYRGGRRSYDRDMRSSYGGGISSRSDRKSGSGSSGGSNNNISRRESQRDASYCRRDDDRRSSKRYDGNDRSLHHDKGSKKPQKSDIKENDKKQETGPDWKQVATAAVAAGTIEIFKARHEPGRAVRAITAAAAAGAVDAVFGRSSNRTGGKHMAVSAVTKVVSDRIAVSKR
jgi:hypothetical protein